MGQLWSPEGVFAELFCAAEGNRTEEAIAAELSRSGERQQYTRDVAFWYGTVMDARQEYNLMLKRIFTVLYQGGLAYLHGEKKLKKDELKFDKDTAVWKKWSDSKVPIASALSHGGRVMLQLPKDEDKSLEFFRWLWGGLDIVANERAAATHGIGTRDTADRVCGKSKRIEEIDGSVRAFKDLLGLKSFRHFGVNLALGGEGNVNPFSFHRILPSGSHGHLYLFYKWPKEDGAGESGVLIGCEGSGPTDRAGEGVELGRWMGKQWPKDQTGHLHTVGSSGTFSPTGGMKWKALEWHDDGPFASHDAMFVDLSDDTLRANVQEAAKAFDPTWLGHTGVWPA